MNTTIGPIMLFTPIAPTLNPTMTTNMTKEEDYLIYCKLHDYQEAMKFIATLFLNTGGVFITTISVIMAFLNKAIDPSLRGILLSYSIANFIGTLMLTFDTIMTICYSVNEHTSFVVVISISIYLSLFHMMFLLLAEYQILTSVVKRSISSFSGLIIVSWIISVCVGCTVIIRSERGTRIALFVIYILTIVAMVISFVSIIKKSQRRMNTLKSYEKRFLDLNYFRSRVVKRYWKLKYFATILFTYVVCATPWIIKQIHGGTFIVRNEHARFLADAVVLMIYTLNFYFPSGVIIYLWIKMCKENKLKKKLYHFAKEANVTQRESTRGSNHIKRNVTQLLGET